MKKFKEHRVENESREDRTLRFLSTGLLGELVLWRKLIETRQIKSAKVQAKKIHQIIKQNDLITSLVWSLGSTENMQETDLNA